MTNTNMITSGGMEKFVRASPMNSNEEIKCEECEEVIFEKELFMLCQVKGYDKEVKLKNICCDCFKKKVEDGVERVQKWSRKTVDELLGMLNPIQAYMDSETKKQIDSNRKMLKKIEGEEGI